MDIDKIFGMFMPESGVDAEVNILDIYQHPAYKIGMFKKMIRNIPYAVAFSLKGMGNSEKIDEIREFIKSQIFRKAFEFLEEINLPTHQDVIKNNLDPLFKTTLELSLEYFISTEEYEKCIVLKSFLNLYEKDVPQ
jgi:hypothetical protein